MLSFDRSIVARLLRSVTGRFRRSTAGTSAVEFALISPVLVLMLGAAVELSGAVTAGNRATYVAETIAQLVSQSSRSITVAEMHGFIKSAALVDPDILTYAKATGKSVEAAVNIAVTSVEFSQKNPACKTNCAYDADVVFSEALAGPKRACGKLAEGSGRSMGTLAPGLFSPSPLVVVDVELFYRPLLTTILGAEISYKRQAFFRPRNIKLINYANNCPGHPVS